MNVKVVYVSYQLVEDHSNLMAFGDWCKPVLLSNHDFDEVRSD